MVRKKTFRCRRCVPGCTLEVRDYKNQKALKPGRCPYSGDADWKVVKDEKD